MKVFLFLLVLINFNSYAETFRSEIFHYDSENKLVKFNNGRVAKVRQENIGKYIGKLVEAKIDDKNFIESIKALANRNQMTKSSYLKILENNPVPFEATVLPSYQAANELFHRLDNNYVRRSECTDRAHVWAYDEFKKNGVNSNKIFIFFTASYINRNNFKWWFHVAPLVKVNENGKIVDRVLDYQFMDRPSTVKEWSDLQVSSKRDCKVTSKFSEYDVNPQTEDCYMIYESMYYRLPGDIHAQEIKNEYRNSFSESEVNLARKTGFRKINTGAENE